MLRSDGVLELYATVGLNPQAVHLAQLRLGQGLVGTIAASAQGLNLSDAQSHPAFAYLQKTAKRFTIRSSRADPEGRAHTRRSGRADRTMRTYREDEVEALETTGMVLAEMIASGDLMRLSRPGVQLDLKKPITLTGLSFNEGLGSPRRAARAPAGGQEPVCRDAEAEKKRLDAAVGSLRLSIDDMLSRREVAGEGEHRAVLEAYRMFAHDRGWVRRLEEAINNGLTAEAAVEKVQSDTRARMLHMTDPYLRERLNDFDDLATGSCAS